jgi:acyl dehydratase
MGEAKLYFEDVKEGDEAPVLRHTLERTDLVRYAGASGDYNPMHHDEVKAQAAGQPSVFGHGMFSMGLLGVALTDFVGVGNLTHYQVRFSRQTWPGEQLSTRVVVAKTRVVGDRYFVDLECSLSNQDSEEKVSGVATAELPSVNAPKPTKKVAKKAASAKKTAAAKKVTSAKKSPASKKATAAKKVPASKKTAAKKASPAKKAATAKKAVIAKKTAAAKKALGSKKASATKKATPAKKAQASKKVPASKKTAHAKKAPAKKAAASKR